MNSRALGSGFFRSHHVTKITVLNRNSGKQHVESHLENSRQRLDGDEIF